MFKPSLFIVAAIAWLLLNCDATTEPVPQDCEESHAIILSVGIYNELATSISVDLIFAFEGEYEQFEYKVMISENGGNYNEVEIDTLDIEYHPEDKIALADLEVTGLTPDTDQKFKFLIEVCGKSFESQAIDFKTKDINEITVISSKAESIKKRSAYLKTEIQVDGNLVFNSYISYQIFISVEENPNSSNSVDFFDATDMKGLVTLDRSTGKGFLSNAIENLEPGTKYYYKIAMSIGQYSNETEVISFTTEEEVLVEGGLVFYDKGEYTDGWRYLVTAQKGWYEGNNNHDPQFKWGCENINIDSTFSDIGSGLENTIRIIQAGCEYDAEDPYAAKYIYDLELNGYDDWFMPSYGELNMLFKYKDAALSGYTLSSTQNDSTTVDAIDSWGYGDHADKGSPGRIRPIRRY